MILWIYLLVLVYSVELFLKTFSMSAISKIVFLNKQINTCWFKYKLSGFYNFHWRKLDIGQYRIYRKQTKNSFIPQKRGISAQ